MNAILLLTDLPRRSQRLASHLRASGELLVIDVLDPDQGGQARDLSTVTAIVSDVSLSHSAQVAGLRAYLDRLKPRRPPFLCLLHEDSSRSRVQADALGATRTLRAEDAARGLVALLGEMTRTVSPAVDIVAAISEADEALTRIFELGRSGSPLETSVIAQGTELVVDAVNRADIRAWLDVVWRFDDMTHQHCLLVAGLAAGFARQLALRPLDCRQLTQAALLHDLGKSRIPLTILNKPDKLDAHELAVMRTHPELGHRMLQDQGYPDAMLAVVRSHHEALDGSGYPDGLRSERIPDLVRLITVCDIFAALIERRPYRRPLGGEEAYDILKGMDGKVDPDFVRAFKPLAEAAGGVMVVAA
ncbi:MAG: HD domain-containing protein [Methylobacterium sp.]|uniref:HD-GYP domain-containing protein n=1 Tax=Methylobacterium sp. TaxID=409 RepID=UPI0025FB6015|nr:HD domain-containing phosphohydrolase [Methylobacterium sp.]MBX9933019.1 HD domain-containing protein [Methylobacterium sp.]